MRMLPRSLTLGSALGAVVVIALAGRSAPAAPTTPPYSVDVTTLGAMTDGTNPTATAQAFVAAFAGFPNGQILVPAGTYAIDNSNGGLVVPTFSGALVFQGNACLIFQDSTQPGLKIEGGTAPRLLNFHGTYAQAPTARTHPILSIQLATDPWVDHAILENSPSSGIIFTACVRPKITNSIVLDSYADGVDFFNCQDGQAFNITTVNTGDDGLAWVNYAPVSSAVNPLTPSYTGGNAANVTVRNSNANGISVVGQAQVVVENFVIDGTASSGINIEYNATYMTQVPDRVSFQNGVVDNAGTVARLPGKTQSNITGINVSGVGECSLSDIEVRGSADTGFDASGCQVVNVKNVRVTSPTGLNVMTGSPISSSGFRFTTIGEVSIEDCTAEDVQAYGFEFSQCPITVAKNLTAINASQQSTLNRAVWFESCQRILSANLNVIDTQNSATGFVVGFDDMTLAQTGSVNGIASVLDHGTLSVQSRSPNVLVTNVNAH